MSIVYNAHEEYHIVVIKKNTTYEIDLEGQIGLLTRMCLERDSEFSCRNNLLSCCIMISEDDWV